MQCKCKPNQHRKQTKSFFLVSDSDAANALMGVKELRDNVMQFHIKSILIASNTQFQLRTQNLMFTWSDTKLCPEEDCYLAHMAGFSSVSSFGIFVQNRSWESTQARPFEIVNTSKQFEESVWWFKHNAEPGQKWPKLLGWLSGFGTGWKLCVVRQSVTFRLVVICLYPD